MPPSIDYPWPLLNVPSLFPFTFSAYGRLGGLTCTGATIQTNVTPYTYRNADVIDNNPGGNAWLASWISLALTPPGVSYTVFATFTGPITLEIGPFALFQTAAPAQRKPRPPTDQVWWIIKKYLLPTKPPAKVAARWIPPIYYWTTGSAFSPTFEATILYWTLEDAQAALAYAKLIYPAEASVMSIQTGSVPYPPFGP